MPTRPKNLAEILLLEELDRIIEEAARANEIVQAEYHAGQLMRAYPAAGYTVHRIVEQIAASASAVNVPVEINPCDWPRRFGRDHEHA